MYKNDLARIYKTEQLELCHGGEPVLMYLHLLSQRGADTESQVAMDCLSARLRAVRSG